MGRVPSGRGSSEGTTGVTEGSTGTGGVPLVRGRKTLPTWTSIKTETQVTGLPINEQESEKRERHDVRGLLVLEQNEYTHCGP